MTRVEQLEQEVASLSDKELREFRRWYGEFDARVWDREVEADVRSGALDRLAGDQLDHSLDD